MLSTICLLGNFISFLVSVLKSVCSQIPSIRSSFVFCLIASPPPDNIQDDMVIPNNTPEPYTFAWSKVTPTKLQGGSVKVADSRTFKVSKTITAAEVTVEVGGMRYIVPIVCLLQ